MLTISRAEMKSTLSGYPSSNLIDGKLDNFGNSLADDNGMWVRVYLEEPHVVTKIIVYNRQDCCKDRLIGVSVFIKLGNKTVTDCGKFKDVKDFYEFDCKGEGSVIELNKVGEVGEWNIAEIVIYGGEYNVVDRTSLILKT